MKSTGLIFQDFSIAGIRKQWHWQTTKPHFGDYALPFEGQEKRFKQAMDKWTKDNIGCKTETRRTRGLDKINEDPERYSLNKKGHIVNNDGSFYQFFDLDTLETIEIKCPYGVVGDEIWVKEAYGYVNDNLTDLVYKESIRSGLFTDRNTKWKSPLFMPKAASRIKLDITNISIERLQDITEEGAKREGVAFSHFMKLEWEMWFDKENVPQSAKEMYRNLWIKMHGKESWDKNPFVWVIQFNVKEFK